jgi:hypothetical protein
MGRELEYEVRRYSHLSIFIYLLTFGNMCFSCFRSADIRNSVTVINSICRNIMGEFGGFYMNYVWGDVRFDNITVEDIRFTGIGIFSTSTNLIYIVFVLHQWLSSFIINRRLLYRCYR